MDDAAGAALGSDLGGRLSLRQCLEWSSRALDEVPKSPRVDSSTSNAAPLNGSVVHRA